MGTYGVISAERGERYSLDALFRSLRRWGTADDIDGTIYLRSPLFDDMRDQHGLGSLRLRDAGEVLRIELLLADDLPAVTRWARILAAIELVESLREEGLVERWIAGHGEPTGVEPFAETSVRSSAAYHTGTPRLPGFIELGAVYVSLNAPELFSELEYYTAQGNDDELQAQLASGLTEYLRPHAPSEAAVMLLNDINARASSASERPSSAAHDDDAGLGPEPA